MKNKRNILVMLACLGAVFGFSEPPELAAANPPRLLNDPVDISGDFHNFANLYYLADTLADFDPATGKGEITYQRSEYFTRLAFDNMLAIIKPVGPNEFPENEYAANPTLPFSVEFVSPRTVRIRIQTGPEVAPPQPELMLAGPVPQDHSWKYEKVEGGYRYASPFGSVTIQVNPWRIEFRDAPGRLLTETDHASDNTTTFTSTETARHSARTEIVLSPPRRCCRSRHCNPGRHLRLDVAADGLPGKRKAERREHRRACS